MKYRYREPHELKESGIEWIGKIPKDWEVKKFSRVFKESSGNGFPDCLQGRETGAIPFFKVSDINLNENYVSDANNYVEEEDITENNWKIISENSILLPKIGEALKKNHRKINKVRCLIDNNMLALSPKFGVVEYFLYLLKIVDMDWFSNPSTVPTINIQNLKNSLTLLPDFNSQYLIASFLDKKCAEFDGIIGKKQRIISKLEEAKRSLISEVVTGKVRIENGKIIPRKEEEMKESGIEWIGKIPEEWEVTRVKRFLESQKQGFYTTEDYADSGVKLVRITDINDSSEISYEKCPHVEINEKDKRIFDLKKGDFLFARSGTIGRFGVVENEENAVFASYLIRFRFSNIKERYLKHYFSSELFKACLFSSLHGGANQNIHAENIKEPFLMVPSDFEQSFIASFLDEKTAEIDSVITKIREQIEKIKKAKQSLISEAVTGKIEVMG